MSAPAFAAAGVAMPFACAAGMPEGAKKGVFAEPARDLPLAEDCDVIVAGGGPAGISAAVAAARAGAKVRLFELHGALGGVWTSGFLGCLIDFDKSATDREIMRRLEALDVLLARNPRRKDVNGLCAPCTADFQTAERLRQCYAKVDLLQRDLPFIVSFFFDILRRVDIENVYQPRQLKPLDVSKALHISR